MEREKQLRFCKICKNQKFDIKQGIICGLTEQKATFDLECAQFEEDAKLKDMPVADPLPNTLQKRKW
ncbi:hypothetical protein [Marinilabilia sp.]|jgi:hypothetical protein